MQSNQIETLKADMAQEMQNFIIDQVDGPLRDYNSDSSRAVKLEPIVTNLSRALKQRYDGVWQVVILTGSYSAFSAYTPDHLFHFKFGRFVVLVWQSSSY